MNFGKRTQEKRRIVGTVVNKPCFWSLNAAAHWRARLSPFDFTLSTNVENKRLRSIRDSGAHQFL